MTFVAWRARAHSQAQCVIVDEVSLIESIDVQGIQDAWEYIGSLHADAKKNVCTNSLVQFMTQITASYGPDESEINGVRTRRMVCRYARTRQGRLYAKNTFFWNGVVLRNACAQGAPRVLRPFLYGRICRDYDIENCHICILYQMAAEYHTWPEHSQCEIKPLRLTSMRKIFYDRSKFIDDVANVHGLMDDADVYDGYRKDVVKQLINRVVYGGSYDSWMEEHHIIGRKCIAVLNLIHELKCIRKAFLTSTRFRTVLDVEREHLSRQSIRKSDACFERSMFASITQHIECEIMLRMLKYFHRDGWTVHSLFFDGIILYDRPGVVVDTQSLTQFVYDEMRLRINVLEKPLFRDR